MNDHAPALSRQLQHDAVGRITQLTQRLRTADGERAVTQQRTWYDGVGRPVMAASSTGHLHGFAWDSESQLAAAGRWVSGGWQLLTRAGSPKSGQAQSCPASVTCIFDDFGRTVLIQSPDSGTTFRAFDPADRLLWVRNAKGQQAQLTYDLSGRLLNREVRDATGTVQAVTQWTYDRAQLIAVNQPGIIESHRYDASGFRVGTQVQHTDGGTARAGMSLCLPAFRQDGRRPSPMTLTIAW